MPLVRCKLPSGGSGWKVENGNKCFSSKKDAEAQLAAIKISQTKRGKGSGLDPTFYQQFLKNTSLTEISEILRFSDLTTSEQAAILLEAKNIQNDINT